MRISDWSSDVCSSDLSVIWAISMGGFLQDQKIVGGDLQADRLAMGEVAPLDAFGDQRLRLADLDEQPGAVAEEEGGRDGALQRRGVRCGDADILGPEQDLGGGRRRMCPGEVAGDRKSVV